MVSLSNKVNLQNLSEKELIILRYILEHKKTVISMSIQHLAEEIGTSSSSILRFTQKLGLSGFAELKFFLKNDLIHQQKNKHSLTDFSYDKMINSLFNELQGTQGFIRNDDFDEIMNILLSDIPIFLFSPGGITSITITYFEKQLLLCGRQNVFNFQSSKMANHIVNNTKKDFVLFLVSTSGLHKPTLSLAKVAKLTNCKIVTISPYSNNELSSLADYSLRFFSIPRENNGAEYTSRLCIFYIFFALIERYKILKKEIES